MTGSSQPFQPFNGNITPFVFALALVVGVSLRLALTGLGHNTDLESWHIVANIVAHGGNVYAETDRYNYGPFWFNWLHLLDMLPPAEHGDVQALHWKVAISLTLVDVAIAFVLRSLFNATVACLFILNPISIVVSGYHGQFDNVAVLFGFLSVFCMRNNQDKLNLPALVMLGLSLCAKHLFFLFPFWLAMRERSWKNGLLCLAVPYAIFLISFAPYWPEGWNGIIKNVFLYKSYPYTSLYIILADLPFWQPRIAFGLFLIFLLGAGWLWRRKSAVELCQLYCVTLVALSSAATAQYLAICVPSISAAWNWGYALYTLLGSAYMTMNPDEIRMSFWNFTSMTADDLMPVLLLVLLAGLVVQNIRDIKTHKQRDMMR